MNYSPGELPNAATLAVLLSVSGYHKEHFQNQTRNLPRRTGSKLYFSEPELNRSEIARVEPEPEPSLYLLQFDTLNKTPFQHLTFG